MAHDVFISYSAKDKPTADAACAVLESMGIRCWIEPRDAIAGADADESRVNAIQQSRIMVLIFSADANGSPQIRREIEQAVDNGVTILPLRVEDILPSGALAYYIGNVHWLDALTPPLEACLKDLAGAVALLLARMQSPEQTEPSVTERDAGLAAFEAERTEPERRRGRGLIWVWICITVLVLVLATVIALRIFPRPSGALAGPGTWRPISAMPVTTEGYGVGTANGIIYVAGGGRWLHGQNNPRTVVGSLWAYNPKMDLWTKKAPMPTPRAYPSLASVNGILYAAGGCADWDCAMPLATVEAYDGSTNTWKEVAPMSIPRRNSDFLVSSGGLLYAAGGMQGTGCSFTTAAEAYSPSANEWTELPRIPESRNGTAVGAINNVIYIAGGNDCNRGAVMVGSTEAFDTRTGQWSFLAALPVPVSDAAFGVIDGKLYLAGGSNARGLLTNTQVFDPVSRIWNQAAPLPEPLSAGTYGAVVDGVFYLVGVHVNGTDIPSSTNFAYTPNAPTR